MGPSMFHAGSFKHSVTSSHLMSLAQSCLFVTADSSALPSYPSREWPALEWSQLSPKTLHTVDGTHTHATHAMNAMLAAQRFVVVDFYGLRLDISTSWIGGSWDPVATMSLPAGTAVSGPGHTSRHYGAAAADVTHVSQQACSVLEDFTVSMQTTSSPDACAPCSVDVQCPSGVHAALSMVSVDVLVDCMHALHASVMLPHHTCPDHALDTARAQPADAPLGTASLAFLTSPVATDNFDGAESDEEYEQAAGEATGEDTGGSVPLPRWSQVAQTFGGLQEVCCCSVH